MALLDALDHILQPVDEYQMQSLRNAALCGIMAFAFIIVGVKQLLALLVYLFAIAFICVSAWLYLLTPDVRREVLDRIRDVIRAFWRKCVDDTFDVRSSPNPPGRDRHARQENRVAEDSSNVMSATDDDESQRIDRLAQDFTGLFN